MDNRKVNFLLSLRGFLTNSIGVMKNSSDGVDSMKSTDMDLIDTETDEIYKKINALLKCSCDKYVSESRKLLDDLNCLIDKSCNHEFVEDEIEHIFTGGLVKIKYCSICEKTI